MNSFNASASGLDMLSLVKSLLRIPTVSRDSNLAFIHHVTDLLRAHGVTPFVQYQADGRKANLVATFGPPTVAGIALAGHTDVVPVERQAWSSNPFEPIVADGRLVARGACDMKGFIGVALARLLSLDPASLERPVHLVLTYDEEVGCGGAKELMRDIARILPVAPFFCVVGEPTNMEVLDSHKGMRIFRTFVKGRAGHSSIQSGTASAVTVAARLIDHLATLGEEMATRQAARGDAFQYPFTTVNVGTMSGGQAVNIVAPEAEFEWEYRYLPGADGEEIFQRFQRRSEEILRTWNEAAPGRVSIFTEEVSSIPALDAVTDARSELVRRVVEPHRHGRGADYCTEAGLYQRGMGCPVVLCGPGSIQQAHKADEYVTLDQLAACDRFLQEIIHVCSHTAPAAEWPKA